MRKKQNKNLPENVCTSCEKEVSDVTTRTLLFFKHSNLCEECYIKQLKTIRIRSMIKFLIIAISLSIGTIISIFKNDNFTTFFYFWFFTGIIFIFFKISDKIANEISLRINSQYDFCYTQKDFDTVFFTNVLFKWTYYCLKAIACLFILIPYTIYHLIIWIYCSLTLKKIEA